MAENIRQMTVEQYFALEAESEIRYEFIDGEIYPMPGGTLNHDEIIVNTTLILGTQLLDSGCRLYSSNMRVRIGPTRYVYPDLSAVCGEAQADDNATTLLNPIFVAEVTSPSSRVYDHISKVEFYGAVPSIQGYLILDQERIFAEWYTRTESGWHLQQFNDANRPKLRLSRWAAACNSRKSTAVFPWKPEPASLALRMNQPASYNEPV